MDVTDLVSRRAVKLLRSKLLHFLLLGGALHLIVATLPPGRDPIVLSAAQVQDWRIEWTRDTGRAPTAAQERAGLQKLADDEALLREALYLGLERSDPVARSRMVQNLRFADPASTLDDGGLVREALALGMARGDVVVRRRLVQAMEQRLAATARVDDAQVDAFVAANPQRYATPARYTFRQVFFTTDVSVDAALQRAHAALDQPEPRGDGFLLGTAFEAMSRDELARTFDAAFADAVAQAKPGRWIGPLRSPYGVHLARVERIDSAAPADLARVKTQARYALLEQCERQAVRDALARLRQRYPLQVEPAVLALAGAR